ncbi:hypothetical protein ACFP2T_10915 [Plantactinospora solaniradicis]|uniref:Secreted protein n=1 Tax=Plantactinospora solaniradicis TaxID=1723736 RepID=A0ABW1K4P5_9ACTN
MLATIAGLTVYPSAAWADGGWHPYTKSADWFCEARNNLAPGVAAEVCVVVRGRLTQAVTAIRNTSGNTITIEGGYSDLYVNGSLTVENTNNCNYTPLSNGYAAACFGPTRTLQCSDFVFGRSMVDTSATIAVVWSSPERQMCQ